MAGVEPSVRIGLGETRSINAGWAERGEVRGKRNGKARLGLMFMA